MIYCHNIGSKLPCIRRLKLGYLDFHNYITMQTDVVKQHINEILCFSNLDTILTPYESKSISQFQQKFLDIIHQCIF